MTLQRTSLMISMLSVLSSCRHGNLSDQTASAKDVSAANGLTEIDRPENPFPEGRLELPQMPDCAGIDKQIARDYQKFIYKVDKDFVAGSAHFISPSPTNPNIPVPIGIDPKIANGCMFKLHFKSVDKLLAYTDLRASQNRLPNEMLFRSGSKIYDVAFTFRSIGLIVDSDADQYPEYIYSQSNQQERRKRCDSIIFDNHFAENDPFWSAEQANHTLTVNTHNMGLSCAIRISYNSNDPINQFAGVIKSRVARGLPPTSDIIAIDGVKYKIEHGIALIGPVIPIGGSTISN